jgi:hypothetical protein
MHVTARNALATAALAVVFASPAGAFDAAAYHAQSCMRCHDTSVYTREDRRIRSYPALQAQVARCDAQLQTKLFPDDLASLVEYLNDNYYGFAN